MRVEASLKQVTDTPMAAVEPSRVVASDLMHAARQRGIDGLYKEMIMIRHEDVGVHAPMEVWNHLGDQTEELAAVAVIEEDVATFYTAAGDVPPRPRIFEAQRSGHERSGRGATGEDRQCGVVTIPQFGNDGILTRNIQIKTAN